MSSLNRFIGTGMVLLASLIWPYQPDAQVTAKRPWGPHPQEFVQSMATQASLDREKIQQALRSEKQNHDQLQEQLKVSKGAAASSLRTDIKNSSNKLEQLQEELAAIIKRGKEFKDLIGQPDKTVIRKLEKMDPDVFASRSKNPEQKKAEPAKPVAVIAPPDKITNKTSQAETRPTEEPTVQPKGNLPASSPAFPNALPLPSSSVQQDCLFQSAGSDNKPGLALRPEILLKYTPDVLRKYMGGQAYITGRAFIATEPGITYLQLHLEFATEQALRQYGNLGKSILLIRLINGKEVRLVANRFDQGMADPELKKSTMSGIYYVDKPGERLLADTPVDRIRLIFATGYEDFVIYNVDFFTRQLACINAQK